MLKSDEYNSIYAAAQIKLELLPPNKRDTNNIAKIVDESIKWITSSNFPYRDKIIKQLTTNFTITSSKSSILSDSDDHQPWYFKEQLLNRKYWESYRDYLKTDKQYSMDGVNSIDETTDKIMSLMENPKRDGSWDVRGLVVGSVQSGKTSNFIGLINKAADAGYKGFIILSGLHNNLRQQTQTRIDQGFLGYETSISTYYSQHKLPLWKKVQRNDLVTPVSLTNANLNGDFKKKASEYNSLIQSGTPTVLVIKKNKTILTEVIKHFLNAPGLSHSKCNFEDKPFLKINSTTSVSYPFIKNYPILVIDDEVDNASVDTGLQDFKVEDGDEIPDEEYNPKTINRLIRQLLHIFEKKAYVGYSASPFANIFIHHQGKTKEHGEDLFPKNFILDLPIPQNHTGLDKVFAKQNEDVLEDNDVEDKEIEENIFCQLVKDSSDDPNDFNCNTGWMPPSHDKYHIPKMDNENELIPYSLKKAIYSFILTCLVRNLRGELLDHKTMLIHVSRFTDVQLEVKKLIEIELEKIRNAIVNNLEEKNEILKTMKKIWLEDFYVNKFRYEDYEYPEWGKIIEEKELNWLIQKIVIKSLNIKSEEKDDLNYEEYKRINKHGLNTIVIGGDKLSRGLTLEGLTISYFLRSAKMPMYDTLMQMGRWFGYRAQYEDLCRIYTSKSIVKFFFHICKATAEFRALIRLMSLSDPPERPVDFGLRVQNHELMAITNRYKMRHARPMLTCFAKSGHEFLTFSRVDNSIDDNIETFKNFLNEIGKENKKDFSAIGSKFNNCYQWVGVDPLKVINLLNKFKHFPSDTGHNSKSFSDYIKKMNNMKEINNFTVTLLGNGTYDQLSLFNKYQVKPLKRKIRNKDEIDFDKRIHFGVITNESIEGCDLTDEEYKKYIIKKELIAKTDPDDKISKRYAIRSSRSPDKAALNIYPIYAEIENEKKLLMTLSISFPSLSKKISIEDASISYMVNTIYEKTAN